MRSERASLADVQMGQGFRNLWRRQESTWPVCGQGLHLPDLRRWKPASLGLRLLVREGLQSPGGQECWPPSLSAFLLGPCDREQLALSVGPHTQHLFVQGTQASRQVGVLVVGVLQGPSPGQKQAWAEAHRDRQRWLSLAAGFQLSCTFQIF